MWWIWIYRIIFLPGLLVLLPRYLRRMWRRGGYSVDWQQRFGRGYRLPEDDDRPQGSTLRKKRIWIQAVSVGEILAIKPLLEILREDDSVEVVLTTTTSTGYNIVREQYGDLVDASGIFPMDFWLFSRRAWKQIKPDLIILMEGELWPEHIHQATKRHVPVLLINARMSDRSMSRYQRIPTLVKNILSHLSVISASTGQDLERFKVLAGNKTEIILTGNIKVDVPVEPLLSEDAKASLRISLGLQEPETTQENRPVIILGSSTWPGEETALIDSLGKLLNEGFNCRLLLIPRHAERKKEIQEFLEDQELSWHFRSDAHTPPTPVQIYVGDTTGELKLLSQAADLAFIGKSLPPLHREGQTPIEAAGLGLPLLMGPELTNFREIARSLVHSGGAKTVADKEALHEAVRDLLVHPGTRQSMAKRSQTWHRNNRGAVNKTINIIRQYLK